MKDIFKQLIREFLSRDLSFVKDRNLKINLSLNKIISIVGARRTGKTHYLFFLIKRLRENKDTDNFIYINFEDDRLFPCTTKEMDLFLEAYYELFPENKKKEVYFFFDEIQNVPNWEKFVRRIYDTENCRIFITGSSSKLLSKEISTSLRGRSLTYEIFPLSFREYLNFRNINDDYFLSYNRAKIKSALNRYINYTSMPELVNESEYDVRKNLKNYLDLVIYKDIVERYGIKNIYFIRYLIKFLIINSGNLISSNKMFNDFKSQGLRISRESIYEYMEYIKDSYVNFTINIFSDNLRERNRNPMKTYFMDTGFKKIMSIRKDYGRMLESAVFLELRRNYEEISYFKKKQEVDFCFIDGNSLKLLNVCSDISDKVTKRREVESMDSAMQYFGVKKGFIITEDYEEKMKSGKSNIFIIPLYKWLLKENKF